MPRNASQIMQTVSVGAVSILSFYVVRAYRRRYVQGQIISLRDYLFSYPARRRMRDVLRTIVPLWKSSYNFQDPSPPIQFKESDVIVFAPPKCGTTWVTHMCHQIRTRGSQVTFQDQDNVVPWIERLGTPYLEGTHFHHQPNAPHVVEPRVFKSHLTWDQRPQGAQNGSSCSSYKQIWVFRNCVDMMVSTSHFLPSLWGIDPPLQENEMCSFLLGAGDVESAFQSLASVWETRHNNNHHQEDTLLLLFYENIVRDHSGTVQSIANFMNIQLSETEMERIIEQTTKKEMLKYHNAFACGIQAKSAHKTRGLCLT
mmetsp:Transcript_22274/g.31036  ORF Transcript_22274/g.31036 Transcript_22274/m.31036 type:complete len:313 (-) Transcript_22274:227-1165(-)